MRRLLRNRLPCSYYVVKQNLNRIIRRYKSVYLDKGELSQKLLQQSPDCILIYETECASKQYRVNHAMECFHALRLSTALLSLEDLDKISEFRFFKNLQFVLLHRIPLTVSVKKFVNACKLHSIPVIFDLDDAIHNFDIYKHSAVFDILTPLETKIHRKLAQHISQSLDLCDAITVSTSVLSDYVSALNKPVRVIPNRVSPEMVQTAANIVTPGNIQGPLIGYFSGTETHHRDFLLVINAVKDAFNCFPEARLIIAGLLKLPHDFKSEFFKRIICVPFKPWPDFLQNYYGITVNLAPLESDNPFCRAKSGVKYLESALSRVPTIATATSDYQRLISDGKNGFLALNQNSWTTAIKHCLNNPDAAKTAGKNAFEHVMNYEMITANLEIWQNCLSDLGIQV